MRLDFLNWVPNLPGYITDKVESTYVNTSALPFFYMPKGAHSWQVAKWARHHAVRHDYDHLIHFIEATIARYAATRWSTSPMQESD